MTHSKNLTSRSAGFALGLLLAAVVCVPGVANAQDGTISGAVTDTTGGVLPGVTVEAQDAAGSTQATVTDGTGQFMFSGLVPGTYDVTFTLFGFTVPTQVVEVSAGGRRDRATPRTRQPRRPHPSSASDSTNRTRSACREIECFW